MIRLNASIQPNMQSGVYFKTWDGSVNGVPPTGGGGGGGSVRNVTARNVSVDRVSLPIAIEQTNDAKSGDKPSTLMLGDITFEDWQGTSLGNNIAEIACSPAAPCADLQFIAINVTAPAGEQPMFICQNVINQTTSSGQCVV